MTKKLFLIVGIVILIIAGVFYWYQNTQASVGSLNIYNGSADVIRAGETSEGRTGTAIKLNDSLKVKSDSRISVVLKDGSVVRLEAGSEVKVAQLEYNGRKIKNAVFNLKIGRLWSHTETLGTDASYEVETPTVVAAVRGTSFNTDYLQAINKVFVYKHFVDVTLAAQTDDSKTVGEGQIFVISDANAGSDFNQGPRVATESDNDDWVKFNITEDAKLDGSEPIISLSPSPSPSPSSTTSQPPQGSQPSPTGFGGQAGGQIGSPAPSSSTMAKPTSTNQPISKKITSLLLTATDTSLKFGDSVLLKVEATYSDGSKGDVGVQVAWSQNLAIGNITSPGFFRGVFEGTTKIRALLDGVVSNEVILTVTKNKQLVSIEVSFIKQQPTQISGNYPTAQFKALAVYSDDSSTDVTDSANWSVTGTAEGTINTKGFYTPRGQGSDRITANLGGINGSTTINIS